MNPYAAWWRDVAGGTPDKPVLVLALADDPSAVSALPLAHSAGWLQRDTATARVARYLEVQVVTADEELPDHDLLLVGSVGRGVTTLAAAMAVAMFDAEPHLVTGYGSAITDLDWMDKVVDVRSRVIDEVPAPVADLVAVLERARSPVLLDGVLAAAAAAVAETSAALQAPVLGAEPVQKFFLDRANVAVWGSCGVGPGEGLGALSGLAMLRLALLAES